MMMMMMMMTMMMVLMRKMTLGWAETFQEFAFDISRKVELGWDLIWSLLYLHNYFYGSSAILIYLVKSRRLEPRFIS